MRALPLLLLLACVRPSIAKTHLKLDPEPALQRYTETVAKCLNKLTGTDLVSISHEPGAIPVLYVDNPDPNICGTYSYDEAIIRLDPDEAHCPSAKTLVHEIGHAAGFWWHSWSRASIMYERISYDLTLVAACESLISELSP